MSYAKVEEKTITENGTYTAPDGVDGFNPVTVAVPTPEIKLQEKTITENGEYTADAGFDGLLKVLVDVAASGSANIVRYGYSFYKDDGAAKTLTHNKGAIPDIAYFCATGTITGDGQLCGIAFKDSTLSHRFGMRIVKSGSTLTGTADNVGYWDNAKFPGLANAWIQMTDTKITLPPRVVSDDCHYGAIWIDPPQT